MTTFQGRLPLPASTQGMSGLQLAFLTTLFCLGAAELYAASAAMLHPAAAGGLPILAVFAAATLSAIAGFAFSGICGAMLLYLLDTPGQILIVLLTCSIANQALAVALLWRQIPWRRLLPFLAAGAAGSPCGIWLLNHCNPQSYVHVFGAGLATYCAIMLVRPARLHIRPSRTGDVAVSFVGGVLGGFAAFPGATVALWLGMKGWDKTAQRALCQPFILAMQLVTLVLLPRHGAAVVIDPLALLCLPVSLLGTWCGMRLFRGLTDRQFGSAVTALLGFAGLGMLLR